MIANETCPRCGGSGITVYDWVEHGVCFLCRGAKIVETSDVVYEMVEIHYLHLIDDSHLVLEGVVTGTFTKKSMGKIRDLLMDGKRPTLAHNQRGRYELEYILAEGYVYSQDPDETWSWGTMMVNNDPIPA